MRRRSSRSASAAEKNGPNSIVKRADGAGAAGVAIAEARGPVADGGVDVAPAEGIRVVGGGVDAGGAADGGTRAGAVTDGVVTVGGMIDAAGGSASGAVGGALGGGVVAGATGAGVTGVDAAGALGGGATGGVGTVERGAAGRGAPGRGGAVGVADGLRRWRSSSRGLIAAMPPERHTTTAASAPTAPSSTATGRIRFLKRPRPPVARGAAFVAGGSVATDSPAPASPFTAASARPRPNQPSAWSTARCTRPPPPRGDSPGVSSP